MTSRTLSSSVVSERPRNGSVSAKDRDTPDHTQPMTFLVVPG